MNKLNPANVAAAFEREIDVLLAYYERATVALRGTPTESADISLLNEQVLLSAAVSFEGALSDLYFAYVNKDSSRFLEVDPNRWTGNRLGYVKGEGVGGVLS